MKKDSRRYKLKATKVMADISLAKVLQEYWLSVGETFISVNDSINLHGLLKDDLST